MSRTSARAAAVFLPLLAALLPGAAAAQPVATLGVGVAKLGFEQARSIEALVLSPILRADGERWRAAATGALALLASESRTADGLLAASRFTPTWHGLTGELAGSVGALFYRPGSGSVGLDPVSGGHAAAQLRAHLGGARGGAWAGAGRSGVLSEGDIVRAGTRTAGLWLRFDGGTTGITVTRTGYAIPDTSDSLEPRERLHGWYRDGVASLQWARGRAELQLSAGVRVLSAANAERSWAAGAAAVRATPRLAVTASYGKTLGDPIHRTQNGRFAMLGVRIDLLRRRESAPARAVAFEVDEPDTTGRRAVRVHAPRARRVELAANFTGWDVVTMEPRGDGWFETLLPIEPGTHRVSVRVDGGAWSAPPGLPIATDDFAGETGVLLLR